MNVGEVLVVDELAVDVVIWADDEVLGRVLDAEPWVDAAGVVPPLIGAITKR